jgi:pimeloyl-ACP methyl ester carboxylesterase
MSMKFRDPRRNAGIRAMKSSKMQLKDYTIIHKIIQQPVDHADPDGPKLDQHVDILIPEGTPPDAPVFFNLGNEQDLTDEHLTDRYALHGDSYSLIYVQAEHRGYGQSLTQDEDQSVPSYVRIDQALADAHKTIRLLKQEYSGPWMAAGWSYGGALVINFAVNYPEDVKVILCSSGVVDWPFLNTVYEQQVRKSFSEGSYRRLVRHCRNLRPQELHDDNWLNREFLRAVVMGLTQKPEVRNLRPYFELMTILPTWPLLKILRLTDRLFSGKEGWYYALSMAKRELSRDEAATGKYGWRVWRYQQCIETGVFQASESDKGLFVSAAAEIDAECRALFDMEPPYDGKPLWSPREMLDRLTVPMIYVAGGKDPWFALGIERDYRISNGRYFYLPDAQHCPDRHDAVLARQVLDEMLKYAKKAP